MRDKKGRYIKGQPSSFRGRKHTLEARAKQSESHKGKVITWFTGHPQTEETKRKISEASLKHWSKESYRKKVLARHPMSKLEEKFQHFVNKHKLPYKFVGNGDFSIGRKVPDFINTNGEKKAIEVYWNRHKEEFRGGLEQWKQNRSTLFAKYGWEIIYFEGSEVNEKNILRHLYHNDKILVRKVGD